MYKFIGCITDIRYVYEMVNDFQLDHFDDTFTKLYIANFDKYAKLKSNKIEVEMELLTEKTNIVDRSDKYLWYSLPINKSESYFIAPFLDYGEVMDVREKLGMTISIITVEEWIIKNIIE